MSRTTRETDTAAAVLAAARDRRSIADRAEADQLQLAVDWAAMHSVDSLDDAATYASRGFGDTGIPLAGPGAPLVAEFAVAEFAAAIGLPTETGKRYVGEGVELRYRLSRVWARVTAGDLPAWRARRIASETICLSAAAAAFVDQHVASVAHKVRPSELDRLVEEAIVRFMPEEAARRRREASDGRHFTVNHQQVSFEGTSQVWGELDLADALDLDAAVSAGAQTLKALGSTESLDARRATAVGELARRQLALDLNSSGQDTPTAEPTTRQPASARPVKPRQVVLYVHLTDAAVRDRGVDLHLGRLENTRSMVTADQIRDWCGNPDAQITVKPVIDLADHIHVDAYEVPDRLAEQTALVNHTCVFPWCTRPARRLLPDQHRADCDHIDEAAGGGPTCSCNLAPLCRTHHRLKTHGGWRYIALEPGSYLWTSPHGYQFLRDHTGTLDVSADRRGPPPDD